MLQHHQKNQLWVILRQSLQRFHVPEEDSNAPQLQC
jgi:hypothetical protein